MPIAHYDPAQQFLKRESSPKMTANKARKTTQISGFEFSQFLVRQFAVAKSQHRRILGETIHSYRKQSGMSQEHLSEKAELSPKYIGEVERGYVNISVDSLLRIAKALSLTVNDLTRQF